MVRLAVFVFAIFFLSTTPTWAQPRKNPWPASPHIVESDPLRPEEQLKKFKLPPGFEIQLVAGDPDIRKPININFDAAGRLFVTETIEYPIAAAPGKGRDGVKILEDFGPDGRARKITTLSNDLNIPIGVIPVDPKKTLVFSIPAIYELTDTDGDGKADEKKIAYSGYGFRDTHGMTGEFIRGFDGWIYACHGFANESQVKSQGNTAIKMQSGNTYRMKADGSRIEQYTWGQVNPFGLAIDPLGYLYTADCHTRPLYQLIRGAYYPSFGKPHDGLGFGPEMVQHDHGSTAIGGVAYYADDLFPKEFQGNLFIGNVVTCRVNRDRIDWRGSSPQGVEMPDFVKCDDKWFRPVDIKLGPDGALYIADFYNRIIGHYEVPLDHPGRDREKGRIWRIIYKGDGSQPGLRPIPNLYKASPDELLKNLSHPNLTVRLHATHQLAALDREKDGGALWAALASESVREKIHGLWAIERQGKNGHFPHILLALKSGNEELAVHSLRLLANREQPGEAFREAVVALASDPSPHVRRAAAEAMGLHPKSEQVPVLAKMYAEAVPNDTHLRHTIRIALRNQLRTGMNWKSLAKAEPAVADLVAECCLGVHDGPSAEFLKTHLLRNKKASDLLNRSAHYITRNGTKDDGEWLLQYAQDHHGKNLGLNAAVAKAVFQGAQEKGRPLSKLEVGHLTETTRSLLASKQAGEVQAGVDLAGQLRLKDARPALLAMIGNVQAPEAQRKSAVAACVALDPASPPPLLTQMLLDDRQPVAVREQIAVSLANTNQAQAHTVLLKALENASSRLEGGIALGLAGSAQGGSLLLDAIEKGKASPRVLQNRAVELKLKQAKVANVDQRFAKLTQGLPAANEQIQKLIALRREGFAKTTPDAEQGHKLFAKHCANCHQIKNEGAKIGPQLDGVGIRGVDRLLEDILDPSRNVDQAFRATTLVLENGQIANGLLLREEGEIVILADAQGKEQRIPKKTISERQISPLSPMPANFAEAVPEDDLRHLLAYLLRQRVKE